jgi:hypothetical protein
MVDQTDIPEPVHEHVHHGHHASGEGFRRLAAIYVGVVAMLLAIASLGGGHVTKEMLNANIQVLGRLRFRPGEIFTRDCLPARRRSV